ncbi:MAG: class I SAM-dependent methyltransferase, partial [Fidelibacterota bacterium]
VDASEDFISLAKDYNKDIKNINFQKIDSHLLPFEDNSFDVVISMLSFRYLDWDPILIEIERVLSETGKLLIVDMVTAPIKWKEIPLFVKYKTINYINKYKNREFNLNLNKLVSDSNWKNMLKYNPIRSEHEMKWYLESRFPNRKAEIINLSYNTRILAFDSINMSNLKKIKLSYP